MIDQEKVLTWLEICGKNNDCSNCCPYSENGFGEYGQCRESLMADAYDLLKEQEAVEPIPPTNETDLWRCGNCNHQLFRCTHQRYCEMCGREVKWE